MAIHELRIYNTLTRNTEIFKTNEPGKVSMYTCGPTVYHFAHIGNLRSYIMEDVLEKTLRYIGYDVKRVMNITDVGQSTSRSWRSQSFILTRFSQMQLN